VKKFADDPQHAFPGRGQMKPDQLETGRRHGNWGASMACEIGSPLAQEIAS
jgi:hypothetical protein